jgi:integrase
MAGKQAKILSERHLGYLLTYVGATRYPVRNRILVLLSVKAGLRAGEIAGLTWDMVLGPSGEVGTRSSFTTRRQRKAAAGGFRFTLTCALR